MKLLYKHCVALPLLYLCVLSSGVAYAIEPYLSVVEEMSFGELTGFNGSCFMDYSTKEVSYLSGSLCPFSETRYGTPGKYFLFGDPNAVIRIRVNDKVNTGDGVTYSPAGSYSVNGEPDVVINANTYQLITIRSQGFIVINLGGTMTNYKQQNFNSTYNLTMENAIQFTEQ